MTQTPEVYLVGYLVGILIVASVTDIHAQKIPNLLTYPAIILFLYFNFTIKGLEGLLLSVIGLAIGIALFIIPYLKGGMGAGDVKLMGAIGSALGPRYVIDVFLFTAIIGGVYALMIVFFYSGDFKQLIARTVTTLKTLLLTGNLILIPAGESKKKPRLCYAVPMALGTIITIGFILLDKTLPI